MSDFFAPWIPFNIAPVNRSLRSPKTTREPSIAEKTKTTGWIELIRVSSTSEHVPGLGSLKKISKPRVQDLRSMSKDRMFKNAQLEFAGSYLTPSQVIESMHTGRWAWMPPDYIPEFAHLNSISAFEEVGQGDKSQKSQYRLHFKKGDVNSVLENARYHPWGDPKKFEEPHLWLSPGVNIEKLKDFYVKNKEKEGFDVKGEPDDLKWIITSKGASKKKSSKKKPNKRKPSKKKPNKKKASKKKASKKKRFKKTRRNRL